MSETRRSGVVLSVDALMQQWARQEEAPAGSAIIATTEIAGRLRGGVEWRHTDATSIGVLARPFALEPSGVELGWLAASLGAAAGLDRLTGERHRCVWPDRVGRHDGDGDGEREREVVVSSAAQLGPGRIEHIIMIVRIAGVSSVTAEADVIVDEVRSAALMLDEPARLITAYRERCATLGQRVSVSLLPSGSTRGVARDVDLEGALLLESPTGLVEPVPVPTLGRLQTFAD